MTPHSPPTAWEEERAIRDAQESGAESCEGCGAWTWSAHGFCDDCAETPEVEARIERRREADRAAQARTLAWMLAPTRTLAGADAACCPMLPPCDWQDSTPARRHCTRDAVVRREGRAMCAMHADLADERKATRR